ENDNTDRDRCCRLRQSEESSMPSQPEPQTLLQARRQFCRERAVCRDLLREPILRSWARCSELGLDMTARPHVEPITQAELRQVSQQHEALRRICRPEIEALYSEANATDSIVILTDASGLVLDTLGSADFAARASRVALRPGVNWSESSTGT